MAEHKSTKLEREYVIPLRSQWVRVPQYERTSRAIRTIKRFIAKHMKVSERNVDNVKLDVYMNNELWFRGRRHPPSKIKVKAIKEGDIVRVQLAETPKHVEFLKAKNERIHKKSEKVEKKETKEIKTEEKTEEQKKEETEKEKAVAESKSAEVKQDITAEKHSTKIEKHKTQPRRMALQK
ncbi:MAG: 50S ribosomal protein L31e [archaeon]|nr:50S ribosomal protein L31e [archaeon]